MRQVALHFVFTAALLLGSCTETGPRDAGDSKSLMTGSISERNAFIARVMADESDRVAQINMQGLSLEIALEYLTNHLKIDAEVDWDALAAQGISRDEAKTTLNLYDATYADGLRAILWLVRPRTGSVGYAVENAKLVIRPQGSFVFPETAAQVKVNEAVKQKLQEMLVTPSTWTAQRPIEAQFYSLGFAKKMSIIVDWDELTRAGVKRDMPTPLRPAGSATLSYLQSLVNALSQNGPAVAYDIRHGMVRVSTQARLDAEHAMERPAP